MRFFGTTAVILLFLQGPVHAQATQVSVTDWLDRCYAAADMAFVDIPMPRERSHDEAMFKARHIEFGCGIGPLTICKYSVDSSGCLTAAQVWMEQERDRIVAALPRTLAEGQSNSRRSQIRRYNDFIASNGQPVVPGLAVEDCIGSGATLPELGLTRQECELQQVSMHLSDARRYDRRIVAGLLR